MLTKRGTLEGILVLKDQQKIQWNVFLLGYFGYKNVKKIYILFVEAVLWKALTFDQR